MGTFGERLQREREMRGISLEEISQATKIGTRSLRALEEQDFDKLPGGIFNKGFVRSYARYLGIDEDQAVADYEAARQVVLPQPDPQPDHESTAPAPGVPVRKPGLAVAALLLAAAALGAGYFGWSSYASRHSPSHDASAAEATGSGNAAAPAADSLQNTQLPSTHIQSALIQSALPQNTSPQTAELQPDASSSASSSSALSSATGASGSGAAPQGDQSGEDGDASPASGFALRIRALQDCWVSIVADGKAIMTGTLPADSEKSLQARREVSLTVGNAGEVKVYFNGKALPSFGAPQQPRTLRFTPEGLLDSERLRGEGIAPPGL